MQTLEIKEGFLSRLRDLCCHTIRNYVTLTFRICILKKNNFRQELDGKSGVFFRLMHET